jgi:hypothetical protein
MSRRLSMGSSLGWSAMGSSLGGYVIVSSLGESAMGSSLVGLTGLKAGRWACRLTGRKAWWCHVLPHPPRASCGMPPEGPLQTHRTSPGSSAGWRAAFARFSWEERERERPRVHPLEQPQDPQ